MRILVLTDRNLLRAIKTEQFVINSFRATRIVLDLNYVFICLYFPKTSIKLANIVLLQCDLLKPDCLCPCK